MGRGREADRWERRRGRGAHGGAGSRNAQQRPRAGRGGGQWQQWHEGAGNGSGSSKTSEGSASRSAARARRGSPEVAAAAGGGRIPATTALTPPRPSRRACRACAEGCEVHGCTAARRHMSPRGGPDTRRAARCWPRYDRIEKKYIHKNRVAPQPTLKRITIEKTRRGKNSSIQAHAHMSKRGTEERSKNARPAAPGRRTCSSTRHGATADRRCRRRGRRAHPRGEHTGESPLRIGERNATRTSFAVMKEKTIVARVKGECARQARVHARAQNCLRRCT